MPLWHDSNIHLYQFGTMQVGHTIMMKLKWILPAFKW